nr:MAG TPA: hypothetical protein [Bacteriophage sp.]
MLIRLHKKLPLFHFQVASFLLPEKKFARNFIVNSTW